jgi:hypothetical protein
VNQVSGKRSLLMSSNNQTRKILLLSANPKGTSRLRLDEETREIKDGLKRAKKRDDFSIETFARFL